MYCKRNANCWMQKTGQWLLISQERERNSNVIQIPYASVKKSSLCAILMVVSAFPESLSIATESQYAERVLLHAATAAFILDNSEFMLLFCNCNRQSEQKLSIICHPYSVAHRLYWPISTRKWKIDQLFIGNVLEVSDICGKHYINS